MTRTHRRWLVGAAGLLALGFGALVVAGYMLADRFDGYIQRQTVLYLQRRFDSKVDVGALRVRRPRLSEVVLLRNFGVLHIAGENLSLRHKGRTDIPPMLTIRKFNGELDLGVLFKRPKTIRSMEIEGMDINIPPRAEMQNFGGSKPGDTSVVVRSLVVMNSSLTLLPKDNNKTPLHFGIQHARLEPVGEGAQTKYDAALTRPMPGGEILAEGTLGPWTASEPADTPISGKYVFHEADLAVFSGVAGILESTGQFEGSLSTIHVQGQASVPDFRLRSAGNAVPVSTHFDALVDGTNGNTTLKPVNGTIGTTAFTTSGGVIPHDSNPNRRIELDATISKGDIRDLLALGMKGAPFMSGEIFLQTKIEIPPLDSRILEKVVLNGRFDLSHAVFLKSRIQDRIDGLRRRGQGQPNSPEIDQVIADMAGAFKLENKVIAFRALSFSVPGAGVDLAGSYNLDSEALDFHGALKLAAKISETTSGWKRWVLKPVDPFFSKQGAGTLLHIKVEGTAREPKFGIDLGKGAAKIQTASGT